METEQSDQYKTASLPSSATRKPKFLHALRTEPEAQSGSLHTIMCYVHSQCVMQDMSEDTAYHSGTCKQTNWLLTSCKCVNIKVLIHYKGTYKWCSNIKLQIMYMSSTNYSCCYSFLQEVNHNLEAHKVKTLHRALRTAPLSHRWKDFHAVMHIHKAFSLLKCPELL